MLLLLLDTGIRLGELMGLMMNDVSLERQQARVFGKGRKERIVPFSEPVRQALNQYLDIVGKFPRLMRCGSIISVIGYQKRDLLPNFDASPKLQN